MFTGDYGPKTTEGTNRTGSSLITMDNFLPTKAWILVPKVKNNAINEWFGRLPGSIGIGNVRYTTSGKCDDVSIVEGTQPFIASIDGIKLALSFNGNIVNTLPLKKEMYRNFPNFIYNCDSDIVCHKMLLALKQGKD